MIRLRLGDGSIRLLWRRAKEQRGRASGRPRSYGLETVYMAHVREFIPRVNVLPKV